MCRLILCILIVSSLCHVISCVGGQLLNRSLEFNLEIRKNGTGHWVTSFAIDKTAPIFSPNLNVKVKQSVAEFADAETFHLDGIFIVPPPVPDDYQLYPGIGYYKFHTEKHVNFDEAMKQCAKEGSHLAIINSDAESKVLQMMLNEYMRTGKATHDFAYIGFHDRDREGQYVTIFGEPLSSTGFIRWFGSDQPDDAGSGEDCGTIHKNGGLNDLGCNALCPYFCEIDLRPYNT